MIVDIGGGTSEVAVTSLGGIVTSSSLRVGGDKIDQAISNYIKEKHNLAIGEQTAEEIKIKISTALPEKAAFSGHPKKEQVSEKKLEIRGRDLISGLPRNFKVSSDEIQEAISDRLNEIVQVIKMVLRDTPPELSADIIDKGMVLSGGGAMIRNIDELIAQSTGVPCFLADEPLFCVAKGTGVALENLEAYKKSIMTKK
jgi:rod shape-determining protein MreB